VNRPDTEGLPWPEGDPAALRAVAGRSGAVADQLVAQSGRLVASAGGTGQWAGVAHDSFGSAVVGAQSQLEEGADAFQSAAVALDELAAVVEQEQERVVQAAARLREARQAAAAAAASAARAQDAADSAAQTSAASPMDPASTSAAQVAGAAAANAQQRSSAASGEAAQVEARCHAEANAAVDAVERADQATAAVLDDLTGFDPLAALGGLPGSALSALGQVLTAEVGNFWADRYAGLGALSAGLAGGKMYRAWAWGRSGGNLMKYPVFNTGMVGRGTAAALGFGSRYLPSLAGPAQWLGGQSGVTSTMASATRFFRGVGVVGGVASTALDSYNLIQQGNPVDAFEREGAGYVGDVARTGFSASSTALLLAPAGAAIAGVAVAPVLVGAVLVTGAVWLGAEAWEEWGDEVSAFAGDVWDNTSEAVGDAWDTGTAAVGDAWDTSSEWASDTWAAGSEAVGDAWDAGGEVVDDTVEEAGELVDSAGDTLKDAGDTLTFWD